MSTNACARCGDCFHPHFGPNTDGDPCDWCQDCGCASAEHGPDLVSGDVEAEVAAVLNKWLHDDGACRPWDDYSTCDCSEQAAKMTDALAPLIAQRVEAAKAEALREAADVLDDHTGCECEPGDHLTRMAGPRWLRDRAAALDPGPRP